MITKLLSITQAEIGTREEGGNNCGFRVRQYQQATDLPPGAWPWCAAFVCWALEQWVRENDVPEWLNLTRTASEWRPKTALAYGFLDWAKARPKTTTILKDSDAALPGDIVTFDFSHVGIVLEDDGKNLITVEGNTNGKGQRDSETGDGVWRKIRQKSLARNFIRIHPRKV